MQPSFRSITRRRALALAAVAALATAVLSVAPAPAVAADATAWPTRSIRFVVPYLPGGTTDLVARVVGQRMSDLLGQAVVIDNRGGAGGNIGMDVVAKAVPDGYTIGFGAISTNALNPHIYRQMSFDPRRDFTAIGLLGYSTIVLEVGADLPVRNVDELVAYIRAHPGTSYATAGVGTSMNLAGVLFEQATRTELTHVPYKGSSPAINDLLGGSVPMMFDNLPASLPFIQAGKLRALAVTGSQRSPSLPNVPTMAEAGLAGYSIEPWFGLYGPAGMPPAIVARLNRALVDALASPEVKAKLMTAGFTPHGSSPAELETLTQHEYERLGRIARAAHLSVD